jgi:hypothetical protein
LARDRGEKRDNYGRARIPAYWIANLVDRQLELSANPIGGAYPAPTILGETDTAELVIDGQVVARIAVADLLPRIAGTPEGSEAKLPPPDRPRRRIIRPGEAAAPSSAAGAAEHEADKGSKPKRPKRRITRPGKGPGM